MRNWESKSKVWDEWQGAWYKLKSHAQRGLAAKAA